MKKRIDFKRLLLLLTREFALNKNNFFIMIASMTIVSILITYLFPHKIYSGNQSWKYYFMYPHVVAGYCIIVTAFSFIELNNSDRNIEFIMLPASTLEKFLTKLIFSTIGYILIAAFALSMTSIFAKFLNANNPVNFLPNLGYMEIHNLTGALKAYIVVQALFFFGGVYFKRLELVKTFLSIAGILAGLYLFEVFLTWLLGLEKATVFFNISRIGDSIGYNSGKFITKASQDKLNKFLFDVGQTVEIIVLYLLPLFFWLISYLRLKENEVADGV
jgi:hypothetical protein